MDHPFFIVSTYLWLFPFVALVGFATLFTLLPFTTSRPFDASKLRFCLQHISCQQHTYHCYHCFHNLILMFKVTDRPYLFSCLLCLSSASRLQLRHHIVLYWVHKWSFHLHPICYYLPLSTTDYRHFFLHVVSQITLLAASLFELAVYKFLIRLLFMFMSPWKVSEPLSMLFAMVLTFFFITGICCTWWIPKINNVSTVHMPVTCHYLSSIRLWNSWKVCRITTTRWPCGPLSPLSGLGPCAPVSPLSPLGPSGLVSPLSPFGPWGPISPFGPCPWSTLGPWDPGPPPPGGPCAPVSPLSPHLP